VAASRTIVEADYAPDPATTWNGSPTGANVAQLYLDGWMPGVAVDVRLDAASGASPLGLFSTLPNAPTVLWPAWPTWSQRLTLTTDVNGDASFAPHTLDAIEPTGWASTEGGFNGNHSELRCGDDGRGGAGGYQLFPGVTFDLASLPAGTITRATLNIFQVRVDGDSPYGPVMQRVAAEHVRFTNMWEADEVPAIAGTIGQRTVSATPDAGWRSVDVTEAVVFERAAAMTRVQFRLAFLPAAADGDTSIDWAVFASNNAPAPNDDKRPTLVVSVAP
jgi:hypothetical protein